ncbi:MAG: FtsX-like permease family protein [Bacteroidales bacterium]
MKFFHTFKIGLRNLLRERLYTVLNILGFACGITVFVFVSIYVIDQYIYDRLHDDADRIYRLEASMDAGDWALTGTMQGPYLKDNYPEVEDVLRINGHIFSQSDVVVEDHPYHIPDIIIADTTFFEFFHVEFIHGSPRHALTDKYSLVITRRQAENIFGHTDVIGERATIMGRLPLQITGVIENPTHTHLPYEAIAPLELWEDFSNNEDVLYSFGQWNNFTFLRLQPGTNVNKLEEKINAEFQEFFFDMIGGEIEINYYLRPLTEIYFADDVAFQSPVKAGNRRTVNAFILIAFFVLGIAVINFVNLSTARAFSRSKEVGIKKLLGSTRPQLMFQFLVESVLTTALAVLLSLALLEIFFPDFRDLTGTNLHLMDLGLPRVVLVIAMGVLLVGFLSGIYPSFYLTSFQPAAVLKGQKIPGKGGALFRKLLIVFQFGVSVALVSGTIIVFQQIDYMKNQSLGFEAGNVVFFDFDSSDRKEAFREAAMEHPDVIEVSFSNAVPGGVQWQESVEVKGTRKQVSYLPAHANFLAMLGIEPIAGRHFDPDLRSEHREVIMINEYAVNALELEGSYDEVIGQEVKGARIIGIVPDFYFNSPHEALGPLLIYWDENSSFKASVKMSGQNTREVMQHLEVLNREFMPHRTFRAQFLDTFFNRHFTDDERYGTIMMLFAVFALLIACLGLFGLASYMVGQRTREVSIRKVLGAASIRIYALLLKDFLLLVAIGFVLAVPVVWFFMDSWLGTFPYAIQISLSPFLLGGLFAVVITILTVSFHALRLSRTNPAEALKYE